MSILSQPFIFNSFFKISIASFFNLPTCVLEIPKSLYELMSPTIRYIALKYLKNESEADDLVQDFWYDIKKYANGFLIYKNAYGLSIYEAIIVSSPYAR